jgi:NADP-dependent 3-hydroxy acid dehydrogenase YdfG
VLISASFAILEPWKSVIVGPRAHSPALKFDIMVTYAAVQESNARIESELPARLVAVFAGGTSGLGEYTMKAFAKRVTEPRIYFIGRSQVAADRIVSECKKINSKGEYIFMKADLSIIRNADIVCDEIKRREQSVNLLFLTQGTAYDTNCK